MSDFAFNQEYELSELVSFVGEKIESEKVTLGTYISTDNMLVDRGGVEPATKLPAASKFNNFKVGDTLFSNIRTYFRKVWLADFEGGASPDVLIFRSNDPKKLDPNYLYFLLSDEDFVNYTVLTAKGAKMPRGDKAAIMQYKFFLPDIEKQREIGLGLLTINKKIELNRQTNQTLEHIAQAIFKSWFVDFEPTRAKIAAKQAGQDPERAAMAAISGKSLDELDQLSPEQQGQLKITAALFPDALVDSELGEIPEDWEVDSFSKLAKLDTTSVRPFDEPDKVWEHFSIPSYDADESPKFELGGDIKSNKYKVDKNSILSSKLNPHFPRTWWPDVESSETAICSTEFMQFIPISADERVFVFGMILSAPFQEGISQRVTGTTGSRQRAQPPQVANMDVVIPCSDLRIAFSQLLIDGVSRKAKNIKENKMLTELRGVLLPKLLTGELEVANAS